MTNIAEKLKTAPKGLKIYSPLCGPCEISCANNDYIRVIAHNIPFRFDIYGRFVSTDDAECLLFPSNDVRTWENWQVPVEPKFKIGQIICPTAESGLQPVNVEVVCVDVDKQCYTIKQKGYAASILPFKFQDRYVLMYYQSKPHYDISNFKPFDRVLVRDGDLGIWKCDIFSDYYDNFYCFRGTWEHCIPYEGNEHLVGTTDMCGEEFINW